MLTSCAPMLATESIGGIEMIKMTREYFEDLAKKFNRAETLLENQLSLMGGDKELVQLALTEVIELRTDVLLRAIIE